MKKTNIIILGISILVIILIIIGINIIVTNRFGNQNNSNVQAHVNTRLDEDINDDNTNQNESLAQTETSNASTVYMTTNISSEGLMNIYNQLNFTPQGNVAVKLSTGEMGGNYYLQPSLIKELVQSENATIVENNTAYGGSRSSTAAHMRTAQAHGFTDIADVDILDQEGYIEINVPNGKHLTVDRVGSHYANYDSVIVLSHFKGHAMGGFGGAIKNISIGFASSEGKSLIHSAGTRTSGFGGASQDEFLESMAEAALAVNTDKKDNIVYINVMNNLSVDCDCDSNPAEPDMHDIGILASTDPVALDKACVDLVYEDPDGASLIQRIESRNGSHTLDYGAEIGLGNLTYRLVSID